MNTTTASHILGIGTSCPAFSHNQAEIADFMVGWLELNGQQEKDLRVLYRATGIRKRYSVLPDFSAKQGVPAFLTKQDFPGIGKRMDRYKKEAASLGHGAALACLGSAGYAAKTTEITHLVTISCTGMYAPGLDIDLVKSLGLNQSVQRYCINFMGCYAAVQGLKLADSIVRADQDAVVLVVCVELCTLHFRNSTSADDLLAASLFADGAAAVLVGASADGLARISSFKSQLFLTGEKEMAWQIGDDAFRMRLSMYVPDILSAGMPAFSAHAISEKLPTTRFFAVHPGGKKILQQVERGLGLGQQDLKHSYQVLSEYGNMSSPTILFVLEKILKDNQYQCGDGVLGMAFGPGLALETFFLN